MSTSEISELQAAVASTRDVAGPTAPQAEAAQGSERAAAGLELTLRPSRVARILALLVFGIVLVGGLSRVVIYEVAPDDEHRLARAMKRFDLGHEPSIPNWYSSLALVASAGLLAVIAAAKWKSRDAFRRHWALLSILFLLLAVDEAVMIHEMADRTLHDLWHTTGPLYFAWVVPGAAFASTVGLLYLRFLTHLDPRTRNRFLAAATLFIGGAIGIEMVEGVVVESHGLESLCFTVVQCIEERLEMLGIVLFLYALLDYIDRYIGDVRFRFAAQPLRSAVPND